MDKDTIGKLNDWTLISYENLFGLISRKAEICQTLKTNAFWIPVSKVVGLIP